MEIVLFWMGELFRYQILFKNVLNSKNIRWLNRIIDFIRHNIGVLFCSFNGCFWIGKFNDLAASGRRMDDWHRQCLLALVRFFWQRLILDLEERKNTKWWSSRHCWSIGVSTDEWIQSFFFWRARISRTQNFLRYSHIFRIVYLFFAYLFGVIQRTDRVLDSERSFRLKHPKKIEISSPFSAISRNTSDGHN